MGAICIGPSLVRIPDDQYQVNQQNLANEVIKTFILFHEDIFPGSVPGCKYEKYVSLETGDYPGDPDSPKVGGEEHPVLYSEDLGDEQDEDCELEGVAQHTFNARTGRELSFGKGDTIRLRAQVSGDWWEGELRGREGLVPDKYILVRLKEDADILEKEYQDRDRDMKKEKDQEVVEEEDTSTNRGMKTDLSDTREISLTSRHDIEGQKVEHKNGDRNDKEEQNEDVESGSLEKREENKKENEKMGANDSSENCMSETLWTEQINHMVRGTEHGIEGGEERRGKEEVKEEGGGSIVCVAELQKCTKKEKGERENMEVREEKGKIEIQGEYIGGGRKHPTETGKEEDGKVGVIVVGEERGMEGTKDTMN